MPYAWLVRGLVPAPIYSGPGDAVSGAVAWWGLRAYTLASIGANAVRLREDGLNTEQDFVTIAGGGLDLAAISTFKGANNLFVVKLYDQVGSNHMLQATAGNQPKFTLAVIGAKPVLEGDGARSLQSTSNMTQAQPVTTSSVFYHFAAGGRDRLFGTLADNTWGGGVNDTTANRIFISASGTPVEVTATDDTWRAVQWVFNDTSSDLNVDGSVNTVSPGTVGQGAALVHYMDNYSDQWNGYTTEFGLWASAFSSAQSSAMSANQHTYWGF
jgi:hypothetical protein